MTDVVSRVAQAQPRGWNNINWRAVTWFASLHSLTVLAWQYAHYGVVDLGVFQSVFHPQTVVMALVGFFVVLFSITMLPHRNYAHRSYVASAVLQYVLLPFFAAAMQGPIKWWSPIHSMHHAYVDTERDRHSPYCGFGAGVLAWLYGFWWSHMGWLCTNTGTAPPNGRHVVQMLHHTNVRGPVEWEHRHHNKLSVVFGFVLPMLLGAMWGDPVGGLLIGGFARVVANYHCTWIVNSVTHMIGPTPKEGTARNAWPWLAIPLAILSVGEANNHGNHHDRPNSWRFGRMDPGGWAIWLCMQCGLAWENKTK